MYSIIAMVVCVVFSGYFSATETAFTSLNRIRMKNMANDGNKRAREVMELSDNYDNLLSTILVGNNIAGIDNCGLYSSVFSWKVACNHNYYGFDTNLSNWIVYLPLFNR